MTVMTVWKPQGKLFLKIYNGLLLYMYIIYTIKYMRLTCVCVISCIFNKNFYHLLPDNGSFLKGNKFLLIAFVLCHQISSGGYLNKDQEDIL